LEKKTVKKKFILEEYEGTCGKKPSQHSKEGIFHLMVKTIISNECFRGGRTKFCRKSVCLGKGIKKTTKNRKVVNSNQIIDDIRISQRYIDRFQEMDS
jgi:hypothetical protein